MFVKISCLKCDKQDVYTYLMCISIAITASGHLTAFLDARIFENEPMGWSIRVSCDWTTNASFLSMFGIKMRTEMEGWTEGGRSDREWRRTTGISHTHFSDVIILVARPHEFGKQKDFSTLQR